MVSRKSRLVEGNLGKNMKIIDTSIQDAKIIEPPFFGDERGFFAPLFEDRKFAQIGITDNFTRLNNSFSAIKGTIRGMHYQPAPDEEAKMVCVLRGRIWDVALDLRKKSSTFGQSTGVELDSKTRKWFYVPAGCAHGFQTLEPDCEIIYFCSSYYNVKTERGIRWNDPSFNITWPLKPTILSEKDQNHKDFHPSTHL
jgi:dTDP-4-dehydrorhamnose 3,5-epimerase